MLAITNVNNEEKVVYTVPSGKNAYIYIDIHIVSGGTLTIKINDMIYFSDTPIENVSIKLALTSEDVMKISFTGQANIFVHGMEV